MLQEGRDNLNTSLQYVCNESIKYLDSLNDIPVAATASLSELRGVLQKPLSDEGLPVEQVLRELIHDVKDGLNNSTGGRFYGWVIGGNLPASLGADWLTSVWDQNAALYAVSPAASVVEETVGLYIKDLLSLPPSASFAIVSGCQMAHVTALATARHELLARRGYNIEEDGLYGLPHIRILCNGEKHGSIDRAVRFLGLGSKNIRSLAVDESSRVLKESLITAFEEDPTSPTIVLLQAGDIATGSFDNFEELIPIAHQYNAWVHIDGAFGLWARASPEYTHLTKSVETADSWATDGHKWLNVPFDCGFVLTAHPISHQATVAHRAVYLTHVHEARDQIDWNPDWSRRSRCFPTYAAIRQLGRKGIAEMINNCCSYTKRMVEGIRKLPNVEILYEPIINQALVRFLCPIASPTETEHGTFTDEVITAVNSTGEAFFSNSIWHGYKVMRISVCNWRTTEEDIDRVVKSVEKVLNNLKEKYQRHN
jgi:glutamate/tyrosine decarboxylase-like PLP-dependent enzyme